MRKRKLFLAGQWTDGASLHPVRSPFDGSGVAEVAMAGPEEREAAAAAALDAAPRMAASPPHERARLLDAAHDLLSRRQDDAVERICEEAGKPITYARVEALRCLDTLRAAAHVARDPELDGVHLGGYAAGAGRLALITRVPVGPVLGIAPFNFPLNLVAHKIAPAVAAGCPIVLKPASATPSAALLLAEVLQEAGLPDGALSVLPCPGAEAASLVEDGRFRLISFTGSDVVGWNLHATARRTHVSLELGGNAAVMVEPDAGEPMQVARRVAAAAYGFAGQSCIAVQRVLVHRAIYDAFREALIQAVNAVPWGDPFDDCTVCGPLITEADADRVESWVKAAMDAGGTRLAGGAREGSVLEPILLENVPRDADVVAQEVFGPVAVLSAYDHFEAGLAMVNDSRYGLQAGVFTHDVTKIRRAWEVLQVGGIIQGDVPTWRCDAMPYGGVKDSGLGREGPRYAVREMTEERLLVLGSS